jgi:2-enoate reductase
MNKVDRLFEPITINKLTLKNRIAMAPMGLVAYSDVNGGFNENAQEYYIERAKGGTGLIITGICAVDYNEMPEQGLPCPTYNPLCFHMSTAPMNERVHAYGAKIFLQITGGLGRSAMPGLYKKPIAPSEAQNRFDPRIIHNPMTTEEIKVLIGDFVKSAVIAKQSGFDGVEVHAVHEGYLLDQFAIAFFNKRTDEYGGDLRGRLKIATDIVKGIKAQCGEDFPVSLRFSVKSMMKGLRQGALPGEEFDEVGKDMEEGLEAAKILVEAGYDMLNVDAGTYDSWYWNHPPMYFNEKGMYREFGRQVKKVVDVPVILAGRMDDPDVINDAFDTKACDIVSFGRPLLADPYLPMKIKANDWEDIRPCLSCHDGCMGRIAHGLPLSCAVNPQCGREKSYELTPSMEKKNVLIIGGGLAGMEAARVCSLRGHDVTLLEKSDKLGGVVIPGGIPDFKSNDHKLCKWYERQINKLGVNIKLNTSADESTIEKTDADVIIVATGAKPIIPQINTDREILTATDVLLDPSLSGEDIVIIGAGLVGCETGLWLSQMGKNVTMVEALPFICGGPHNMPFMNWDMMKDLLLYNHIKVMTSTKVEKIDSDGIKVSNNNGENIIKADTIIAAIGYKSYNPLQDALDNSEKETYNIGDSREVKNIMQAIWDAFEVAKNI